MHGLERSSDPGTVLVSEPQTVHFEAGDRRCVCSWPAPQSSFFFSFFWIPLVLASWFSGNSWGSNGQSKQQGMEQSPHSDSEKTPPPWQEFSLREWSGEEKEANCSSSFYSAEELPQMLAERVLEHQGPARCPFSSWGFRLYFQGRLADPFLNPWHSYLAHLQLSLSHGHPLSKEKM